MDQNKGAQGGRMGYMYQVHVKPGYTKGNSGNAEVAYAKYTQFPNKAIIGVDIIWQPSAIAHGSAAAPARVTFNASYVDGHAQVISAPLAVPAIDSSWENSSNPNRGIVPCVNFLEDKAGN
jgi:prepilin-type processing-associated H-X9-DG protein